jgi:2'-5' RNA ligase
MRLFIAVDIPADVSDALKSVQSQIKHDGLKMTDSFHITLKFIGEVEDKQVDKIIQDLEKIQFNAFDAKLTEIGVFPEMEHISTIWAGVEPEIKFFELAKKVNPWGQFKAHITLARVKFLNDKQGLAEKMGKAKVPQLTFRVDSVKLYKSTLTREGPVYEMLAEKKAV